MNSILGITCSDKEQPDFFDDLNLTGLVKEILYQSDDNLRQVYYEYELPKEVVLQRQLVLRDLDTMAVKNAVEEFVIAMNKTHRYEHNSSQCEDELQVNHWLLHSASTYFLGVSRLQKQLANCELKSEYFVELRNLLNDLIQDSDFHERAVLVANEMESIEQIRFSMKIQKDEIIMLPVVNDNIYHPEINSFFLDGQKPHPLAQLMPGNMEVTELEQAILKALSHRYTKKFMNLKKVKDSVGNYIHPELEKFVEEVQFYLSFLKFRDDMKHYGFAFTYPQFVEKGEITLTDVYDLALARKNSLLEKKVVCNDAFYDKDDLFFVVTGPNQGGKTTYARSLGQAVFFAKLGLLVPASMAKMPFFAGIMTHFEVEESMMSGEGKLKEELGRLQPMLDKSDQNQFVIINELFTTAATYDAEIMGNRVMDHFIKDGCYGIYVTHIKKLALERPHVASMVASVEEDGVERTYKIMRKPPVGKGHVTSLVDKYHLGYDVVVRRLGK